jgi:hypothetical protein
VGTDFVHRYIFPDAECVPISTTLDAAEAAGFGVRDVENLKDHYVSTLRYWIKALEEHAGEARWVADEITYRVFRLYHLTGLHEFAMGTANLYQILLLKPEEGDERTALEKGRPVWLIYQGPTVAIFARLNISETIRDGASSIANGAPTAAVTQSVM